MSELERSGVVVITGANRGFGRYAAVQLSRDGFQVIATARSDEGLRALRQAGLPGVRLDLEDADSIDAAAEEIIRISDGNVLALINNAATGTLSEVGDLDEVQLLREFRTNTFGPMLLAQRFMPLMEARGAGRVIFISSILAMLANPRKGAYAASKAALNTLASALRMEAGGGPVHVVTLMPGPIFDPENKGTMARKPRFALSHADVYRTLRKALTARRPAAQYRVGAVTKITAAATSVLSAPSIEWLIRQARRRS